MPPVPMPRARDAFEQRLQDRYHHARMSTSQRARWDASDPGAPADTCRYCGKHWRRWTGSKLDGHAACIVTTEFKQHVAELLRDPAMTYQRISAIIGVSPSVVRSWTFPISDKQRRATRPEVR